MKRGLLLYYEMLERLTGKPDYENIVVGAGALARDMRQKLLLLGLKAPFLIGDRSDPDRDIRHYREIAALGDPKRYRFIMCCDVDEWELIAPAQMAAYKFLGLVAWNHPQVIRFCVDKILYLQVEKYMPDAVIGNGFLHQGRPYAVFGDGRADSFHIHLLGACHMCGLMRFVKSALPEVLQNKLAGAGFHSTVYAWGQPKHRVGDNLMRFIRDVRVHKCDLLIFYAGAHAVNPLVTATKNLLTTHAGSAAPKNPFIERCQACNQRVSDGIDHEVDLLSLRKAQQRIFIALARLYGFSFWDILSPGRNHLSENQARSLRGGNPAYFFRKKREAEALFSVLDQRYTKNYTDAFEAVDDIQAMFADAHHFSDEGNRLVAERLAAEILAAFGQPGKGA